MLLNWNSEMRKWQTTEARFSGFHVFKDAREMGIIPLNNGKKLILVTQNQDRLLAFEKN